MAGGRTGVLAAVVSLCAACGACGARSELFGAAPSDASDASADAGADAQPSACGVVRSERGSAWSLGAPSTLSFALAGNAKLRELSGDCTGA